MLMFKKIIIKIQISKTDAHDELKYFFGINTHQLNKNIM